MSGIMIVIALLAGVALVVGVWMSRRGGPEGTEVRPEEPTRTERSERARQERSERTGQERSGDEGVDPGV